MNLAPTTAGREFVSVDVVEDALFLGAAIAGAITPRGLPLKVQRLESNWIRYIELFEEAARIVIVRGELEDHVPTVLKVRALASIDSVPVVLLDQPSQQHLQRLKEAGAGAILCRDDAFEDLLQVLSGLGGLVRGVPQASNERPLSDRELQVAALYVGRTAPSARIIAELLGLPLASVRTHLQRARTILRRVCDTSTREGLSMALRVEGWLDSK